MEMPVFSERAKEIMRRIDDGESVSISLFQKDCAWFEQINMHSQMSLDQCAEYLSTMGITAAQYQRSGSSCWLSHLDGQTEFTIFAKPMEAKNE